MIWRRSCNLRSVAWRKACLRRPASRSESWIRITVVRSHQEKSVGLLSLRTEHPQRPDKAENISGFVYQINMVQEPVKNTASDVSSRERCERGDLNPHALRHRNLNPACLPVPPLSQAICHLELRRLFLATP